MRLLKRTLDGKISLTENLVGGNIPPYAILSHTWGSDIEEVTYKDMVDGIGNDKVGYEKIRFCAEQARCDGLRFFWVDTCCIDKSNYTELSEAINSMFRWYQRAARCYVYLSNLSITGPEQDSEQSDLLWESDFRGSRWFTRGWTLQELLAPVSVEFFTRDGRRLGDKISLEQQIHEITGISIAALRGSPLSQFEVGERLKWAEARQTTREEDWVYCLLGIFGIFMPLLYGEGREYAVRRLRKEIDDALIREHASERTPRLDDSGLRYGDALSLFFIKTRDPGSGMVEVHVADQATGYGPPRRHFVSAYHQQDGGNGTWVIRDYCLYFVKTRNAESGTIELHRVTRSSDFNTFDIHTPTAFSLSDADNGTWTVDGEDLYFIKTKNTDSGKIEVHRASHTNYREFDLQVATALPESEGDNGTWRVFNGDVYFVKYHNTASPNDVEVHVLYGGRNYSQVTDYKTWFNVRDGPLGTWDIGKNGDLYFINLQNMESKKVEVHIATASSKYREVHHSLSWMSEADGPNGIWCMSDF
ncbi:heterokaryon incompatibility protein-domain-containing protein [Ilyonectria robusta]|uniref:heterokaryon incompatibility protein-domain-containing protein n=1 Tax=Ilyonectria robusta TaxID=1079257 RepID=UPI001E8CDB06|nr:heterokaryon incompatibility protein-domain-containing protein [Ilyonectria robusta]KAH8672200.1 heterokaryon incompatibility protein-domain-containing protein [Ilyonectria robusta]